MATLEVHPAPDEIKRFMSGLLDSEDLVREIELHLESCIACQKLAMESVPSRLEWKLASTKRDHASRPERLTEGYEIHEELGRGGAGVVFRAYQASLDRWVAMKVLHRGGSAKRADLARLRREALALAQLDHPNVLRVFDCGEQQGAPYLAMELVEGGSLNQRLAQGVLSSRETAALLYRLASAIAHAHEHGIVHRDLKPQNILLQRRADRDSPSTFQEASSGRERDPTLLREFEPKIADFGLAFLNEDQHFRTETGEVIGTPAYMAPEMFQPRSGPLGPSVDIYGLGMILYECLTGALPFPGSSIAEITAAVLHCDPIPIRALRAQVPNDLQTICMKCLEKEPAKRFATARELADEFDRYLRGEPIRSRPVRWHEKTRRWARRNPWRAIAILGVLSALFVIPAGVGYHVHMLRKDRNEAVRDYQAARSALLTMLAQTFEPREEVIPQLTELGLSQALSARDFFLQLSRDGDNPRAEFDLARVDLSAGTLYITMGQHEKGREFLAEARALARHLLENPLLVWEAHGVIAESLNKEAVSWMGVDAEQAKRIQREAVDLHRELYDRFPNEQQRVAELAWSLHNLGTSLFLAGQLDEATPLFTESIALRSRLDDGTHATLNHAQGAAGSYINLGLILASRQDYEGAEQHYREAIRRLDRVLQSGTPRTAAILDWSSVQLNLANVLIATNRIEDAIEACSEPLSELRKQIEADPKVIGMADSLFKLLATKAQLLDLQERWSEAACDWDEASRFAQDALWQERAKFHSRMEFARLGDHKKALDGLATVEPRDLVPDAHLILADILATCALVAENQARGDDDVEDQTIEHWRNRARATLRSYCTRMNLDDIDSLPIYQPAWTFLQSHEKSTFLSSESDRD